MTQRWADVDLGAIVRNLERVRRLQPAGTGVIAVVKADAYGHGAAEAARAVIGAGAWGLAVSTLDEAAELLDLCARDHIFVMGGLTAADATAAAALGCAVMCHRADLAAALAAAAQERGAELPVHLKVDTGMGRLGCTPAEAVELARRIAGARGLRLAGTFTHFSSSDTDGELTRRQHALFQRVLDDLAAAGIDPGLRHASNSAGALRHPDLGLDAVRAGIALYGCEHPDLEPALALRATVTHVKTIPAGATVGYGATWRAERESRIATVSLGYADGVHRVRSNRGWALIRGRRTPLVGRVSMDATTFDVTDVPGVEVGDTATFIGPDGDERIRAEQVGEWSETISYEVLTAIGRRVERRYRE